MKSNHYSRFDIKRSFLDLGLKKGDNVFIHSNIGKFGFLKEARIKQDYFRIFKEVFFDITKGEGTLVIPVFSYSFMEGQVFDPLTTRTTLGSFSDLALNEIDGVRSIDPNFSIVSFGKNSKYYTENIDFHSFGENSFWKRFMLKKGIFLTFNLPELFLTFRHYIEKKLEVNYRYDKVFSGKILLDNMIKEFKFIHYVRNFNKGEIIPDRSKFYKLALEENLVKKNKLGLGEIELITARNAFLVGEMGLKKDPYFFILRNKKNK